MPNHTDNRLEITTPTKHVEVISKWLRNTKNQFSYEGLIPMPELIRNTGSGNRDFDGVKLASWYDDREGNCRPFTDEERAQLKELGAMSWYDWAHANWGVKWDAYSHGDAIEVERFDYGEDTCPMTEIEVRFTSPWGPPDLWYAKLKEKLHELDPEINVSLDYRLEDDPEYPHSL